LNLQDSHRARFTSACCCRTRRSRARPAARNIRARLLSWRTSRWARHSESRRQSKRRRSPRRGEHL